MKVKNASTPTPTPTRAPAHAHARGLMAESLAAFYLRCKGYRILARRYKTPLGEVDIIATRAHITRAPVICMVEVKTRKNLALSLESITPASRARIRNAAALWLQANPKFANNYDIRFDVVALAPYHWIRHIQNAF